MADPTETDEDPREPPESPPDEKQGRAGQWPLLAWVKFGALCVGLIVLAAAAGYGTGTLLSGAGAETTEPQPQPAEKVQPDTADQTQYKYKDFETITVNLDEPRLARYVRATITVAVEPEHYGEVEGLLDTKMPVLRDWLTVYLASCTLDDVRGSANLNRIRREICDAFNQRLWPDQKPKIHDVLFKEFTIS
ncbi:MAG: hypothetical protein AMK72_06020 [Planctomycetes bacterium SM23_25]|nr:MAG: hypothetical protein AMS14_01595 [Planctomycetes bacterium DG_20]KPK48796.1 MAG: hypothetical protein AMK72_06020 [Planctomycetes bacterium SM23_25]